LSSQIIKAKVAHPAQQEGDHSGDQPNIIRLPVKITNATGTGARQAASAVISQTDIKL